MEPPRDNNYAMLRNDFLNNIQREIESINWSSISIQYNWFKETFGNANNIALNLIDLFGDDDEIAFNATQNLWNILSHQHSHIPSAALIAYDFLIAGLHELNEKLVIELLDILLGFTVCTMDISSEKFKHKPLQWEVELKQKLINDLKIFKLLSLCNNNGISYFANEIISFISNGYSYYNPSIE